jgi:hypothetical protein
VDSTRRRAGLGLLVYGLLTPIAFMSIGSPGGDYEENIVTSYIAKGHWAVAFALAYVGAFASLGLLVFANRMRHELRSGGDLLWGLAVAGTAASVVGWFLVGGVEVSFAEGGSAMTAVPHPVVYLASEMSNLIAVCASSFFIGVAALVLAANAGLPRPWRLATYVAGGCGILAAFFFPIFLFWIWAIAFGGWLAATSGRRRVEPARVEAQLV